MIILLIFAVLAPLIWYVSLRLQTGNHQQRLEEIIKQRQEAIIRQHMHSHEEMKNGD